MSCLYNFCTLLYSNKKVGKNINKNVAPVGDDRKQLVLLYQINV